MDRMTISNMLPVLLIISLIAIPNLLTTGPATTEVDASIKTFASKEELKHFILEKIEEAESNALIWQFFEGAVSKGSFPNVIPAPLSAEERSSEYSTTNIQVAGVDEADIVKTDGRFAYLASENRFYIVDAYPAGEMRVLSSKVFKGSILGLFVNDDRLVVFESSDSPVIRPMTESGRSEIAPYYEPQGVNLKIYDLLMRERPSLLRKYSLPGNYVNSRMIGDWVYTVVTQPAIYHVEDKREIILPSIGVDEVTSEVPATRIHYSDTSDIPATYTTVVAVNVQAEEEDPKHETILTGYATNMYVSQKNMYITMPTGDWWRQQGSTIIHKIAIDGPNIVFQASEDVPGQVLNQFSMDEHEGFFRIATTTGQVSSRGSTSRNNIYVLDSKLNLVGKLEDLAPGEQIYSARFMGERCYLVTFKKIDPLFTIDMSDPEKPRLLGKLKIPGYSSYLHPYDNNHIIGIGKETVEAEEGDFAWYQGLKISLFDVSNLNKPKEVGKLIIGDRGTESPALQDHHAFLFDKKRDLIVIPVLEAEIFPEKHRQGTPPSTHGEYVFQGAYVINVNPDWGVVEKGKITHIDDPEEFLKSGYYFGSNYEIRRSFFIDDILYTVSNEVIKANNLTDLGEISATELMVY